MWSRLGSGSMTTVVPDASRPAISTHDFTWALATGSVYSIPRSGIPWTVNGGEAALAGVDPRAHLAQRGGDAVDRAAADRLVAVERPLAAGLARQPAGREPHQRARVADVDVRLGRARAAPARGS